METFLYHPLMWSHHLDFSSLYFVGLRVKYAHHQVLYFFYILSSFTFISVGKSYSNKILKDFFMHCNLQCNWLINGKTKPLL